MADAPKPPSPKRNSPKSPPPPKLKLDELKPTLSTTGTNTSSNSSLHGGTAFVFTSSRTARSAFSSASNSPATPPTSPFLDSLYTHKSRPSLTASQLAKHSVGALDARCVVGPNMRAAGFVPLAHNISPQIHSPHHSESVSPPQTSPELVSPSASTVGSGGVPTPSEPPVFPPIVFVNPSVITTVPMWDYQRELGWGVSQGKNVVGLGSTPSQALLPSVLEPAFAAHAQSSDSTSSVRSGASSSASIFSPVPSSSSMSSLPSFSSSHLLGNEDFRSKISTNARLLSPLHPVDGYPFPHTPPRSRTESSSPSNSSSTDISAYTTATERSPVPLSLSQRLSERAITGEGTIANASFTNDTVSPKSAIHERTFVTPAAASAPTPPPVLSQAVSARLPSFSQSARIAKERPRPSKAAQLSLTELCESSSGAWVTEPDLFGPFDARSKGGSSTSLSSDSASRALSRTSSIRAASNSPAPLEQRPFEDVVVQSSEQSNVKVPMQSVKQKSSDNSAVPPPVVQQAEQGREHFEKTEPKRRKGKERRRSKSDSGSSGKDHDAEKGEIRNQGRRSSVHSHHHSRSHVHSFAYSSFSFPPGTSATPSAPHVLGAPDVHAPNERQHSKKSSNSKEQQERRVREHRREKDLGALVQAHRRHDREQAKQSERENRGREQDEKIIQSPESEAFDNWERSYKRRSRTSKSSPQSPTKHRSVNRKHYSYKSENASQADTTLDSELLQTRI